LCRSRCASSCINSRHLGIWQGGKLKAPIAAFWLLLLLLLLLFLARRVSFITAAAPFLPLPAASDATHLADFSWLAEGVELRSHTPATLHAPPFQVAKWLVGVCRQQHVWPKQHQLGSRMVGRKQLATT
jgi:hypothetical protein